MRATILTLIGISLATADTHSSALGLQIAGQRQKCFSYLLQKTKLE